MIGALEDVKDSITKGKNCLNEEMTEQDINEVHDHLDSAITGIGQFVSDFEDGMYRR